MEFADACERGTYFGAVGIQTYVNECEKGTS